MKTRMSPALTSAVAGLALALGSVNGMADDIDIYVAPNSSVPPEGAPKVMFTLDWRPNLTSTVCGGSECDFLVEEGYLTSTPTNFFNLLRGVLKRVLDNIDGVQVGLMINHNHQNNCAGPLTGNTRCSNGGYVVKGFTSVDDAAGMADFFARLNAIPDPQGNQSHTYQGAELFFELFRYLTGQGIYNGHNGWTDFGTNNSRNLNDPQDTPPTTAATLMWDTAIEDETHTNYISPLLEGGGCGTRLYTINILFQVSQQEADSDNAIVKSKAQGGMEGINLKGGLGPTGTFGRVIEYLNDVDLADGTYGAANDLVGNQNVTSYFIVDPTKLNQTTNGYAQRGGTGSALALSEDPEELIKTIEDIFKQILSVSTTFVSGSLPIDVFNRVDLGDDVYVAIFRADAEAKPRWNGNLKKLKLVEDPPGNPVLWDARDDPAINPIDGRINNTALTFWTDPDHVPAPPEGETDWTEGSDGRATSQGGAGGDIPGYAPENNFHPGLTNPVGDATAAGPRLLFTEPGSFTPGSLNTFKALNADEQTAEDLLADDDRLFKTVLPDVECTTSPCDSYDDLSDGSADQQLALERMVELLAFARGLDDNNDDGDFDDAGDKRAWFMGDPLHSRPRPVNYGGPSADQQEIRILMTSNDGFLRMFDAETGMENWGFMPRDVMPVLKRLRDNNAGPDPIHPYTIDSTASTLFVDGNRDNQITDVADDIAIAVVGMRRGGKHYYALDIKDPDDPRLLWRIGPDTPGFAQIGQTWSIPATVSLPIDVDGDPDTRDWGFIFAGGYNGDDDGDKIVDDGESHLGKDERDAADYFADADDTEGNAIYIVDAKTGTLLWKATGPGPDVATPTTGTVTTGTSNGDTYYHYQHADMLDSIAADVSVGNIFSDLFDDRAYVGDTGGVIWRVDFLEGDFPEDDPRECTVGTDPRECWKVTRLFSSGRHFTADTLNDRRHHHAVDIALAQDTTGEYVAVVAATGNRAHPLSTDTQDYLYMIKDRIAKSPSLPTDSSLDHDDLADLTDNCLQDETPCETPDLSSGWKMGLVQCPAQFAGPDGTMCGEKGLSKPTTFLGTVRFTTYIPPDTSGLNLSCEPSEGTGTRYAIKLNDATAVFNFDVSNDSENSITLDRFDRLASGGIPSDIIRVGTTSDGHGIWMNPDHTFELDADLSYLRTYWYQEVVK